jgi:hypothetical protein
MNPAAAIPIRQPKGVVAENPKPPHPLKVKQAKQD